MAATSTHREQYRAERAIGMRPDPLTSITTKDRLGNKLVDVVSPDTGFCIGVRSAGTVTQAVIVPKGAASASHAEVQALPRRDEITGLWYVGEDRLVIREVQTPDGPMKVVRVVKPAVAEKLDRRAAAASKAVKAPKDTQPSAARQRGGKSRQQGDRASTERITRPSSAQITAYCRNKYGFDGALSPAIRRAAIVAIKADKHAARFCV